MLKKIKQKRLLLPILKKKNPLPQLKAASLFYALLVALLIGIISTAFITQSYYHRVFSDIDRLQDRLQRNSSSAIQLLQSMPAKDIATTNIDLYNEQTDSVLIKKSSWGLFQVAFAKAFHQTSFGQKSNIQSGLLGSQPNSISQSALYLQDTNVPLLLCGNSELEGRVYRPKSGIMAGKIDGRPYKGKTLVNGKDTISTNRLPQLASNLVQDQLKEFQRNTAHSFYELSDSINQNFYQESIVTRDEVVIIDQQYLKGNIQVIADSLIFITRNTVIEDILIYAPYIIIESGFKGSLQAFATKSLIVERYAELDYPSVLMLINPQKTRPSPSMHIHEHTKVGGLVTLINQDTEHSNPKIYLEKNALINGELYANANVSLKGNVNGHVSCSGFDTRFGNAGYGNHLLDVTISAPSRSEHYLNPFFLQEQGKVGIAKWIRDR